jgi:hypothetical protein
MVLHLRLKRAWRACGEGTSGGAFDKSTAVD